MLPVAKYEELLRTVRSLKQQTIRVRELASPLLHTIHAANQLHNTALSEDDTSLMAAVTKGTPREHMSASSEPGEVASRLSPLYHGTWPVERSMWSSEPTSGGTSRSPEACSVMSFASSSGAAAPLERLLPSAVTLPGQPAARLSQQLEVKVDMVYSLLSMLGTQECPDMAETLLALSGSPESALAMRQAGCLPVLVQLVHSDKDADTRDKASKALYNLVQVQPDDKMRRREIKVIRLLDEMRTFSEAARRTPQHSPHPTQPAENLTKLSFDEGYRQTVCELGGIYVLAGLVEADHAAHGGADLCTEQCVLVRRYAGMALTNLTFGHGQVKSLLCSFRPFMRCLVAQLRHSSDELRQVTASLIRNLSWRADAPSRVALREVGSVQALTAAAILARKESTLKQLLSALWNLSAHCSMNKADICAVDGALGFLVDMLSYRPPSNTLAIIENAGGILRNISSHVAVREDYRTVLRRHGCLQVLLQQLRSPSLTIVGNACGTLWNLSAKCGEDQRLLWQLGAVPMLRSLNHSKHKMIATGSRAALKNLLSARPHNAPLSHLDNTAKELGLPALPTLGARKQRALVAELDHGLTETCDNIEPTSPRSLVTDLATLTLDYPSPAQRRAPTNNVFSSDFTDRSFEDDLGDGCDQPVDYSRKYSESKNYASKDKNPIEYPERSLDYSKEYADAKNYSLKSENSIDVLPKFQKDERNTFTDYAETDLDQPTDYSLRYGENDSDVEEKPAQQFFCSQDTVKTYCTEGTPYQTPYNFSTATSLSDLRVDSETGKSSPSACENQRQQQQQPTSEEEKEVGDKCITPPPESDKLRSPRCYGSPELMSPDKPVNYCEEGTPGYFSRVSSLSSLNKAQEAEDEQQAEDKKLSIPDTQTDQRVCSGLSLSPEAKPESKSDREASKVVTFGRVVDYAEETPLMFSRCSSLGSLSSTEQHSIHDDRSSVSDFSRLTSGIISPSELPDSPSQTVPPSPRHRKAPVDFPVLQPAAASAVVVPNSVFEDNYIKYKEVNTPVEFSTNTSLSSLTIDDEPNAAVLSGGSGAKVTLLENGEVRVQRDKDKHEPDGSELSTVSEAEEEDILAACINMGMHSNRHREPNLPSKRTGIPVKCSRAARATDPSPDTLRTYCTEDTPAALSHAGSHSDLSALSVRSSPVSGRRARPTLSTHQSDQQPDFSDDSSNLSADNDNILAECIQSGMPSRPRPRPRPLPSAQFAGARDELERYAVEDSPCQFSLRSSLSDLTVEGGGVAGLKRVLSRQGSLSSLSVDSCGSTENAEQALLEQCISSGMPAPSRRHNQHPPAPHERHGSNTSSKNACATSAVMSTAVRSDAPGIVTADVAEMPQETDANAPPRDLTQVAPSTGCERTSRSLTDNMFSQDKRPYDVIDKCSDVLTDCSVEENASPEASDTEGRIDNRMLDPEAMIESLDRFTAELVSHSSHLESHDCRLPLGHEADTWNEDTSPNDVSFPSISVSAPLVASFRSETDSKLSEPEALLDAHEPISNQFSSINTMTESTIIAMEATKILNVVHSEADMLASVNSLDLDHVNPPSVMESLVSMSSSVSALGEPPTSKRGSPAASRKKSLPAGLMVRRALSNSGHQARSLDNLEDSVSGSCNLEYIKPPSVMGDYMDMLDMESSMVSVASITSEVADPAIRPDFLSDGPVTKELHENLKNLQQSCWTFDVKQPASTIENINPPSLLAEVTDLCNSTADVDTEKAYNSEEAYQDCLTHTVEDDTLVPDNTLTADDLTEDYSDANSATPVQSDLCTSSAESTPKRSKTLNKQLTPKQRRQLAKERYKTYTVAAELVVREQSDQPLVVTIPESPDSSAKSSPRLTPKERRQLDRERFMTRVLDGSQPVSSSSTTLQMELSKSEQGAVACVSPPPARASPRLGRTKTDIRRTMQQKRLENRERFRTRTLSGDSDAASPELVQLSSDELHCMLRHETDIILNTLEQNTSAADDYLDCETLSLVSNDEDSEHNSVSSVNYRTYHKSWGFSKNLPVVPGDHPEVSSSPPSAHETVVPVKPKIVKPAEGGVVVASVRPQVAEQTEEQAKAIRGKKKAYVSPYRSPNLTRGTGKTVTSNLVRNVTSTLQTKSGIAKPAANGAATVGTRAAKPPSTGATTGSRTANRTSLPKMSSPQKSAQKRQSLPLPNQGKMERQGTFVKEEPKPQSRIARAVVGAKSKSAGQLKPPGQGKQSAAGGKSGGSTLHSSSSSQNLGSARRSTGIPTPSSTGATTIGQRSNSNVSLGSQDKKKQVTSKIASLWRRVEETKKKSQIQGSASTQSRVWITSDKLQEPAVLSC